MINLKKSVKNAQWNILGGILLLILAFFIIITSDNEISSQEETSTIMTVKTTAVLTDNRITEAIKNTSEASLKNPDTDESDPTENSSEEETTVEPETQNPKDLIDFDAEYPYLIRVNRAENFAIVYGMDKDGHHTIPYKAFICSTGLNEDDTPLGVFEISDKYRWRLMVDGTYAQYAIRIYGQIMLHSIPYLEPSSDTLEYWEYNKLGRPASLGCVRFRAGAIKWIYNNCPEGTKVNIYSQPGEIPPIDIPTVKKIKKSNPNSGWDPTDPAEGNPWREESETQKNSTEK